MQLGYYGQFVLHMTKLPFYRCTDGQTGIFAVNKNLRTYFKEKSMLSIEFVLDAAAVHHGYIHNGLIAT